MTPRTNDTERTNTERRAARAYVSEFLPAVVGYGIVLAIVVATVDFDTAGRWKYPVALLPVIPAMWGAVAIARNLDRIDELQRSIHLSGMALGFGMAMVAALTLGFLAMAGFDGGRVGPWIIYSIGMIGWLLGSAIAGRRVQ